VIDVRPFEPDDIAGIVLQPMQTLEGIGPGVARGLVGPLSFTARDDDGEVLVCAGILELWHGRGFAWSIVSAHAGRRMLAITGAVRRMLDVAPFRRVECYVDAEFGPGMRWARVLGFRLETPRPMLGFFESGRDAYLWSRVRDE